MHGDDEYELSAAPEVTLRFANVVPPNQSVLSTGGLNRGLPNDPLDKLLPCRCGISPPNVFTTHQTGYGLCENLRYG